jgi:DnaK suppressor protein
VNELTDEQAEGLQVALRKLQTEIEGLLRSTREAAQPVDLDEPIGRLTRMDAIQQQKVTSANRRTNDIRLQQVKQALGAMRSGRYGLCRRCQDPIGFPRLEARPESPYCFDCQEEVDRKHGLS